MIIKELDEKATVARTKYLFEKELPKLMNMAHKSYLDIKSPVISNEPNTPKQENNMDDKMSLHNYAIEMLNKIIEACGGVDEHGRKFIEARYFKHLTWYEITDLTGYSRSRGTEILNKALINFAWAFIDVEDMRCYVES